MTMNPFTRRHFLRGAQAMLALPFLPSLAAKGISQLACSAATAKCVYLLPEWSLGKGLEPIRRWQRLSVDSLPGTAGTRSRQGHGFDWTG
jgi:hypothetical protein